MDNESRAPKGSGSRVVDPASRPREPNQTSPSTQPEKLSRSARWKQANPKAVWAHACLHSALRRGLIERQPCTVCGTTKDVEGHHPDYDKPMSVIWACRAHHREIHKAARRQRVRDG